jgi:hypothetical protein
MARAIPNLEKKVGIGQAVRRGFTTLAVLALATAPELGAQVGLSTGVAQVALIARSAPRASFQQVSPVVEMGRDGAMKDMSVSVRLLANTSYRLVVVGTAPATASRLWVRSADGDFQELSSGTAVTVAREVGSAGEWEREVSYRTETSEADGVTNVLPVRYEIRVEPTI